MKVFWFIFSLFVFTLSVIPCCTEECQEEELTCSTEHHQEDEEEQKNCSPFCTCTVCGLYACIMEQVQVVNTYTVNESPAASLGNPYTFHFTSEFEVNIWQPPKLG
ncbi:hypothetical protein [Fluviicola taffensis]|uniref:Uncharacterized protein n=1 Tax=Fluviicola taffensis (strain DSM 16823 / NCIMB 13979 / RW262) TaxID=755732 RepID=F2IEZ8_FLUTR|nr:hypothetical protein [Fluviicola taffensis]AEA42463.1 hypothetical protein Fluta_0457 [Fluviicola taffensis DSM 16823]